MRICFEITPDNLSAEQAGEALLQHFVGYDNDYRWGYNTSDFSLENVLQCEMIEKVPNDDYLKWVDDDLLAATICCGSYAKIEMHNVKKYHLVNDDLMVYLFWDGDGTVVIRHIEEGWILTNYDIKNASDWHWIDKGSWVNNLPDNYYEEEEDD
tara:strand:- start:4871 stop:5332 length:462 start_codon:yes stop_codon:yes gene_type:complete